jgi:hypothetical protein
MNASLPRGCHLLHVHIVQSNIVSCMSAYGVQHAVLVLVVAVSTLIIIVHGI